MENHGTRRVQFDRQGLLPYAPAAACSTRTRIVAAILRPARLRLDGGMEGCALDWAGLAALKGMPECGKSDGTARWTCQSAPFARKSVADPAALLAMLAAFKNTLVMRRLRTPVDAAPS